MVDMEDAAGVGTGGVDGRVEDKSGNVHSKVRCSRIDHVSLSANNNNNIKSIVNRSNGAEFNRKKYFKKRELTCISTLINEEAVTSL